MEIPKTVKIKGILHNVHSSARGYLYITTLKNETIVKMKMNSNIKKYINDLPYEDHFIPWQREMSNMFTVALKNARKHYKK